MYAKYVLYLVDYIHILSLSYFWSVPLMKHCHTLQASDVLYHCQFSLFSVVCLEVFIFPLIFLLLLRETLRDILQILRNTGNPQVEYIIRVMKKWAKDNRVPVS